MRCAIQIYVLLTLLTYLLSTLSQKSATVAEFRRCLAVFGDSRTFLRQCGQGFRARIYTNGNGSEHKLTYSLSLASVSSLSIRLVFL